jgi:hypothetical protein
LFPSSLYNIFRILTSTLESVIVNFFKKDEKHKIGRWNNIENVIHLKNNQQQLTLKFIFSNLTESLRRDWSLNKSYISFYLTKVWTTKRCVYDTYAKRKMRQLVGNSNVLVVINICTTIWSIWLSRSIYRNKYTYSFANVTMNKYWVYVLKTDWFCIVNNLINCLLNYSFNYLKYIFK